MKVRITPWDSAVPGSGSREPVLSGTSPGQAGACPAPSVSHGTQQPQLSLCPVHWPDHPCGICDLVMLSEALF